jgi:hypothetical protein
MNELRMNAFESSRVESYVTTDGQSASLSWNKAHIWGLRQDFYYCQKVASLLMWGALSDERTFLLLITDVGPRQCSQSRVRVPWDSRQYFIASDMRLPFSSPPTSLSITVEVIEPTSTRDKPSVQSYSHCDWRSVSKSWCRAPSGAHDQIFITVWQLRSRFCEAPSLTRGRVCLLYRLLALANAVFLGSESLGLRFETFLFVASYDSQGHGGGIRPRLHTG